MVAGGSVRRYPLLLHERPEICPFSEIDSSPLSPGISPSSSSIEAQKWNWRVVIDVHLLCWEKCREMSGISDHSHEPHHFRRASPVSSFSSLVLMKLGSHPVNYQISTKGVIEYPVHPSLVTRH
ncbi:hypothetical protein I7I48_09232 [Histoplasma ohiense]|nr:hypothetical protein I7I48_09232 [Histoplasma ohiense (nom. inval.)]